MALRRVDTTAPELETTIDHAKVLVRRPDRHEQCAAAHGRLNERHRGQRLPLLRQFLLACALSDW